MKNIFLLLFILSFGFTAFPQNSWVELMQDPQANFYDIKSSFENYWDGREIEKGKGWKQFKRWEYFIEPRVFPSGDRTQIGNSFTEYQNYLNDHPQQRSLEGQWLYIGNNFVPVGGGAGRVSCISFHPDNSNVIFVGTPAGGIWKSTDGGNSWATNTDNLASMGVSSIVIHPTQPDTMFIGTGDGDGADTYSVGVLVSYDGGNTFQTTGLNFSYNGAITIRKLLMNPMNPDIILAATNTGIYKTTDAGVTWTQTMSTGIYDIEFKPNDPQIVYAASGGKFWLSTDGGSTFTQILSGLPNSGMSRIAIGVTAADEDYVYLLAGSSNQGFYGLFQSTDSGNNFTLKSDTPNLMGWDASGMDSGGQAWYDLAILVSPTNKNLIWTGGVNVWKSTNGGSSWLLEAHWYGDGGQPYVHADIHAMEFVPGSSTTFLIGCDGGIFKTSNTGSSFSDESNNLKIAQIYKMSQSVDDPLKMISGWQDNGTNLKTSIAYRRVLGGDGMDCAIDYTNDDIMYGEYYYGSIYKSTDNGFNFDPIVSSNGNAGDVDEEGEWVTPFILHPTNHNTILVGKSNVYRSTNAGNTWTTLGTVAGGSGMIIALAYAPSDPDYIYAIKRNRVFVCDDGTTFVNKTSNLPTASSISNVVVDPNDPLRAWVTFSGFNSTNKVYFTNNGGTSWTNFSTGLPNLPVNCIVYQNGSNDGLYVGTDMGVFYRNANHTSWRFYSNGLPNTIVTDMEIYYATGKLRASTYGRGIWESDLFSNVENDASVSWVEIPNGNVCNTDFSPVITLKNSGDNDLSSAKINYSIDGGAMNTYLWNGLLHPSEEIVLTLPVATSSTGAHDFEIFSSLPNGAADGNHSNDTLRTNFNVTTTGNLVSFSLELDCFGEEISWEIENASSQAIYTVAAGTYEGNLVDPANPGLTITKEICLEAGCHVFTIRDTEGNGLNGTSDGCASNGTYSMHDQLENLLFQIPNSNGNFGSSEIHNFCVTSVYAAAFSATPTQICEGGEIQFNDLSTTGTNSWNWSFPGGIPSTSTAANPIVLYPTAGVYDVVLQTGDGVNSNTKTMLGYITVYDAPVTSVVFDSIICYGVCDASIELSVTGGVSPMKFDWSNGASDEDLTDICAGNYSVIILDDNGCKDSAEVLIYSPSEITLSLNVTQATCGASDGSATSNVSGGVTPYSLMWSTNESSASISNLGIGGYTLTVTDANDCVVSNTIAVTNPNAPTVNATGMNESCAGDCNGELQSLAIGGTGTLIYSWNNSAGNSDTVTMVCPDTYIISVTDQNLCEDRDTVVIANGTIYPVANFNISNDTVAIGQTVNYVNLSSNANQHEWSFGDGDSAFFSSTSHSYDSLGTYMVVLTSCKNNCCDSDTGYVYVMDFSFIGENDQSDWVKIYPNPTEDLIYVKLMKGSVTSMIKVFDNNGRLVAENLSNEDLTTLNISGFSKGIYFIEINCYDTVLRYKIVKH